MPDDLLTALHWGVYRVETEDGRVSRLQPFERDPDPSPIGFGLPDALDAPCRVRRPAVRRGFLERGAAARDQRGREPFVEVGWDTALDLVAETLRQTIAKHGNRAIFGGSYGWASAGRFHHAQGQIHRFLNAVGGYVRHVDSYSLGAARVLMPHILAPMEALMEQHTSWGELEQSCELFVAFGGLPAKNAQVNSGGASQHLLRPALRRMAARGVRFINVGPIRSDLEGAEVEWLPIRPHTDTALMLALAHVLVTRGLHDQAFLDSHCTGFERFRPYLLGETDGQPKDPAWAAPITGIEPTRIVELALRLPRQQTMINVAWSLQRADHGEQPFWMGVALAAMLGQIGTPGGGLGVGYGCMNSIGSDAPAFSGPRLPQGVNRVADFIPVARIADMLLEPGAELDYNGQRLVYPDIRLVYWAGGNAFHHHQDLNKLVRAWRRPEAVIVHEQFWTAQAKFADIVLPATTALERDDIGSAARDRFMIAMKQARAPVAEARDDYAILSDLAERLGTGAAFTEGRSVMDWLRHLYDQSRERATAQGIDLPAFDRFWAEGRVEYPEPSRETVMLRRFRADPAGHSLQTPSGRIEIFSSTIYGFGYPDCPGHPVWQVPAEWLGAPEIARFPLHLLSNQPATRLHSQLDHGPVSLAAKTAGRETLTLNPQDAEARGIAAGDVVRVFNDRGQFLAGAALSDGIRPGVVQIATGAWYDPAEPGVEGSLDKHGNPNVVTRDIGSSRLSQGCAAQTALVEIERFAGATPAVTAFEPPRFVALK